LVMRVALQTLVAMTCWLVFNKRMVPCREPPAGAGVTLTGALAVVVPLLLRAESTYVVEPAGRSMADPDEATEPTLGAIVTLAASAVDHTKLTAAPDGMVSFDAWNNSTVGLTTGP